MSLDRRGNRPDVAGMTALPIGSRQPRTEPFGSFETDSAETSPDAVKTWCRSEPIPVRAAGGSMAGHRPSAASCPTRGATGRLPKGVFPIFSGKSRRSPLRRRAYELQYLYLHKLHVQMVAETAIPRRSRGQTMSDETGRVALGLRASKEAPRARGGRRIPRDRLWQHPEKLHIQVPYRVAAAIAVMQMGISDYSVIAGAAGLTVEEVERVDLAEDRSVRQLAVAGIPAGEFFRLEDRVRCPKCQAKLSVAPCLACCRF